MTVAELIEKLKQLPQDKPIYRPSGASLPETVLVETVEIVKIRWAGDPHDDRVVVR